MNLQLVIFMIGINYDYMKKIFKGFTFGYQYYNFYYSNLKFWNFESCEFEIFNC